MRTSLLIILLAMVSLSFWVPAVAQETMWMELNSKARMLYQQGQYREAVNVAEETLRAAESTFGADHPVVAAILNNLGLFYDAQGQYAKAEPVYMRSLAIYEKPSGQTTRTWPPRSTTSRSFTGFRAGTANQNPFMKGP